PTASTSGPLSENGASANWSPRKCWISAWFLGSLLAAPTTITLSATACPALSAPAIDWANWICSASVGFKDKNPLAMKFVVGVHKLSSLTNENCVSASWPMFAQSSNRESPSAGYIEVPSNCRSFPEATTNRKLLQRSKDFSFQ